MYKIEKIIFDYGGVISLLSRKRIIIETLSNFNDKYKHELNQLFNSEIIKAFARGEITKKLFYKRISTIINCNNIEYIDDVFKKSCSANYEMKQLLFELKKNYKLYLISDSLPPFSEYIEQKFQLIFEKMYFSNVVKSRKSEKLFDKILEINCHIFESSIYIDDKETYLKIPMQYGAIGIKFDSIQKLKSELAKYKVLRG